MFNPIRMMFAGICLVLATSIVVRADEQSAPKTPQECQQRLEKTLSVYTESNHIEWRFQGHDERTTKFDDSDKTLLLIDDSVEVVGFPFRNGQAVSFDTIDLWEGETYDVAGEQRKLTRQHRSHQVTRYTLTKVSDHWLVQGVDLSNGHHDSNGQPSFSGFVQWHADGFEFLGGYGAGEFFSTDDKYVLGTAYGGTRFSRDGDRLVKKWRIQPYELMKDSDGKLTTYPDFGKPIGKLITGTRVSEPLTMSASKKAE